MRILWIAMNAALYDEKKGDSYGGTGWIGALFNQIKGLKTNNIELGVAFIYSINIKEVIDNTTFYGIKSLKPSGIKKWLYYLEGYNKITHLDYYNEISSVINDFKPDVIHLWGVENRLASVSHYKGIPIVAHLQGLLSLYVYVYYPYGTNAHTFRLDRFSKREWLYNNGVIFGEREMQVRAEIEKMHLNAVPAVMGRTEWDKMVARFNNPNVKYFHVDEALREPFYSAPSWKKRRDRKFIIFTTISETIYKGFDVVMKASAILKEYRYFDFIWYVAGINSDSEFVMWFEKVLGLKCKELNIHCLGRQSPDQLISGLLNSDMYVHPSYIDNSPNSLCEAQYLGVPCCSTNVGGVSSLLKDNITGRLVPSNAPFDMAMVIKDCYDNEEKWQSFARDGMNEARKRHNPDNILKQLLYAYNELSK